MSQNQSYFWHTTRRNVYLKRAAKLHMFLALIAVLTFSTICLADVAPKLDDDNNDIIGVQTNMAPFDKDSNNDNVFDAAKNSQNTDEAKDGKGKNGFVDAFTASISVILFTELGDKTFFIAAIMAMRHPRLIVFTGAISALALMTVLSVVFGMAATIIPKVYTYYISTALFAIFGLKMIYDGYKMKPGDAQEELEEVQSDLRKREDELLRATRSKYEDTDTKRKNSNSDKEDGSVVDSAGAVTKTSNTTLPQRVKNTEMQHRQRKQPNYNNNNNNNINNNGCDLNNDDDSGNECNENDVFLNGGVSIKMSTFHSSPAISSIASSNQTNQTNCDDFNHSSNKLNFKNSNGDMNQGNNNNNKKSKDDSAAALVHSASASAAVMLNKNGNVAGTNNCTSINSINNSNLSLSSTGAAGQPIGELKQIGGNKKRLERDVTATLVQDPESGVVRKASKKGATYLTLRVLMQAFTMTFLAEWGDRSQLTTIILAASKNVYGVTVGGIIGHSICTGLAVIGGRIVAAKISVRTVTIVGGIVFLGFALYALIVQPDDI
ncbi:myb-like protein I isoform X1 [Teleopsis dalmanni]|uniref:myb-like protein I isoform X1 n=1 Tax=Teleopsis dalmanni TaxID=139649 RepID=UPI0018CFA923|nr:myb-like protein I isoform X1 [Teleopsis dalmanni]XP_037956552.1 myb-like protein I isoform X1 [Teleopsis dalmanni]